MKKPALRRVFREAPCAGDVQSSIDGYTELSSRDCSERTERAAELNRKYYDLATDFYEYGWGRSFHFGVRHRGENLAASLARHEFYLALRLNLAPGMEVLDVGSGVGGPMRAIARFSGASIVGVNNSSYQIERAKKYNREAGLEDLCDFIDCDWADLPVEAGRFDAAYAIETTCIAGDRTSVFREIHRVLRNGACFTGYEWCMTSKYDPENPEHREIKDGIEKGGGIPHLTSQQEVMEALRTSGFEILECRDLASDCDPETPWYLPLKGEGLSLQTFRQGRLGQWTTRWLVRALEGLRVLPQGASDVLAILELCGNSLIRAGETGIFTPMLFFHARKQSQ